CMGRLEGKTAIIVGAGQTRGDTLGNGRATAIVFAREGASVLLVDRHEGSANETAAMIREQQPDAGDRVHVHVSDIGSEGACKALADAAVAAFGGRVDILHHNVGIGAGDATPTRLTEGAWA